MRKSIKIILIARSLALFASCVLMPNVLRAEKYQILAFKNCCPTVDDKAVGLNAIFSDSQKFSPNWITNGKGSKYI
ncbi:MAG: hypothetical protein K2I44_03140, partial [Muribaculaceae bacterium]|nr:hypothetical protein [Muribaculaceae bacterium]